MAEPKASEQPGRKRCARCRRTGWVWVNITDPDDEFYTGCTDACEEGCEADHRGEQ